MSRIDNFIAEFKSNGWDSSPIEQLIDMLDHERTALLPLMLRLVDELPEGGTFFDAMISHLSETEFSALIERAVSRRNPQGDSEIINAVFAYAALQMPHLLSPYLPVFFTQLPNKTAYYAYYPWRGATESERARLLKIVDTEPGIAKVEHALRCLLETRNVETLSALCKSDKVGVEADDTRLVERLLQVDHQLSGNTVRKLHSKSSFHIVFGNDYPTLYAEWLTDLRSRHPTREHENATDRECVVGGTLQTSCSQCGGALHKLIEMPSVPHELPISLDKVCLATCLSCLGWEAAPLYYWHDSEGHPVCRNGGDGSVMPEFVSGPLLSVTAKLHPTKDRWLYQDWALANSRENLNRSGGPPTWIQSAEYPECRDCSQVMQFVAQLDSDLANVNGSEWLWGMGGICYLFWCDDCNISAASWQCT